MSQLPIPPLMDFSLDEQELQRGLDIPVRDTVRLEARLLPEKPGKPNTIKRVVATGKVVWEEKGDKSLSKLITQLLYLYFTGNLTSARGQDIALVDEEIEWSDDDDLDLDFNFTEG